MTTVVGIDSAKDRVDAVALIDGKYSSHFTIDLTKSKPPRPESLHVMGEAVSAWLYDLDYPYVFIEDAIMVRNPRVCIQLAHTVGMLLALPYRCEIVTIDSWKSTAIGKGGVTKEQVRAGIIRRMPATEDLYGKRQDLFDATGVAIHGDALLRRGRRLRT